MKLRKALEVERIIGYKFRDEELLERALTHPSAVDSHTLSYQRLEFLGDALLNFFVAEWLFKRNREASEGKLTELRKIMVNSEALAKISQMLGLKKFLKVELSNDEQVSDSILCDVFEALVAAIYLDGGFKAAKNFVKRSLISNAEVLLESPNFINYKGKLLELLQSRGKQPRYNVLETNGPQHRIQFKVGVYIDDELLGVGTGHSKKEAEQQASKRALESIKSKNNEK